MTQRYRDVARHEASFGGVEDTHEVIRVSAPAAPMGDDRPQLRASPVRDRPISDDGMLNRCSLCTKPRVIPSRGDERSETPPCRGIFGFGPGPVLTLHHTATGGEQAVCDAENPRAQRSESTRHTQARHDAVGMRLRRGMLRPQPQYTDRDMLSYARGVFLSIDGKAVFHAKTPSRHPHPRPTPGS